jgi:hypothetical protein
LAKDKEEDEEDKLEDNKDKSSEDTIRAKKM